MNRFKKTVLVFCFMASQVTLPMQGRLQALTSSIKKTALISSAIAYTHSVVTGPQDFTHLPEMSLQSMRDYGKECGKTIENTAKSLKIDENLTAISAMMNKTKTPTEEKSLGSLIPIDTDDETSDGSDTPN